MVMNTGICMRRVMVGSGMLTCVCGVVILGGWMLAASANAATPTGSKTAKQLVDMASEAAIAGDNARQFALLREAVRLEPDDSVARWQLGQIQVDGRWLSVEEAQRQAAADPAQARYRELRTESGETPEGQLALARWCRRNDLNDEARFHWASVLSVQPGNDEALRALDMRWHNGRLASREEVTQSKERLRASKREAKEWAPKVLRWQRAVAGGDAAARDAALEEIRGLIDPSALPILEKVTLGRQATNKDGADESRRQISLALIDALGEMEDQAAVVSLASHSVFSDFVDVRESAAQKLQALPKHDYVPLLLGALAMPLESSFSVKSESDGSVHYWHSLYREGPERDWSFDGRLSAMQHNLGGRRYTSDAQTGQLEEGGLVESEDTLAGRKSAVVARYQDRYATFAAATESQVWNANQATELLNARVIEVLQTATGKTLGDNPKLWWDWWQEENGYARSAGREVDREYYSDTDSYYYGQPRYERPSSSGGGGASSVPPRGRCECFAQGTLVWTKTGQRPIESLDLGDLVLAQNVDTGELAYKPVIARTVRPPSPILKVSVQDEELLTTSGHPFWVAGIGWRMAKELGDAAVLYAVTGSVQLAAVEPAGELDAYNLVVADFNTYFVGESGVLVHDNTPRRPTRVTLPKLATK
jgi:hypothetical protein